MTKYFLILLFALALNQIKAQSICGGDSLLILDSINFDSLVYQKSDTIIDKIKYTHLYKCPDSQTIILGNFSVFDKKNGDWKIIKSNGKPFVKGKFKNNKKHGAWEYKMGCDIYDKGVYKGFSFPISF